MIITKERKKHFYFPRKACRKIYQTNNILYYINRRSEIEYIVLGIYCVRFKGQWGRRKQRRKKERLERNILLKPSIRSRPNFKANGGKSSQILCMYMVLIIELNGTLILVKTLNYVCYMYITSVFITINFKQFVYIF